jgi:hypothetical protein
MQTEPSTLIAAPQPIRWMSGWLFSLAVHLACLLAGMVLVVGHVISEANPMDLHREVGIVLVNRSSDSKIEYFSENEAAAASVTNAASATANAGQPGTRDVLPAEPPPTSLPNLPQTTALTPGGDVVVGPKFSGSGKGKQLVLPGTDEAGILAADAAERARRPVSGPTAEMSLFGGKRAIGNSFVFVIDRSKSMGGDGLGAIEAAAKELRGSIDSLTDQQRFQVIAYNEQTVFIDGRRLLPATAENRQRLTRFVGDLAAFGPTEHERAIVAALSLRPDVIYLFSDAGDPLLSPGQVSRLLQMAAGKTTFHCVRFFDEADDDNFMQELAAKTKGSYVFIRVK